MVRFMGVIYFLLFLIPIFYIVRFLFKTSLLHMVVKSWQFLTDKLHIYQFYKVPQFNNNFQPNQLYRKINLYLNSLPNIDDSSDFTTLLSGPKSTDIFFQHNDTNKHPIHDSFLGASLSWTHQNHDDVSSYVLKIKKSDKRRILREYFQHIITSISDENKLYYINATSGNNQRWRSVPFTHPATLDTVVMDADIKNKVRSDLEQFVKSKQYYHRLGRVWKRSYLLYGPTGTGKTTFAAAIAKFLSYDLYDIDVSKLTSDFDLKQLMLQTTPKSLILVEDLDRYLSKSQTRSTAVSSSSMLNFMDGIMSCCGEERVLVFTMKGGDDVVHVDGLRPGRVDVRVPFPLCDFSAFKCMAGSYLGVKEHKLFGHVEEGFESGGRLSAAEIGEMMISNRGSPSRALKTVITALQNDVEKKKKLTALTRGGSGSVLSEEEGGVFCRESVHTVREFRNSKLYGLLRMGSRRKEEPPLPLPLDRSSSEKEGSRHQRIMV